MSLTLRLMFRVRSRCSAVARHAVACAQARASTRSSNAVISPVRSATSMTWLALRNEPSRIADPHQRLDPVDAVGVRVDDRLIEHLDAVVGQCAPDLALDPVQARGVRSLGRVVQRVPVGAVLLDVVHGGVGVAEQCLGGRLVVIDPDADADRHRMFVMAESDRAADLLTDSHRDLIGQLVPDPARRRCRGRSGIRRRPGEPRCPPSAPRPAVAAATWIRTSSPAWCPRESLIRLNPSRSQASTATRPPRAVRRSDWVIRSWISRRFGSPVRSSCIAACSSSRSIVTMSVMSRETTRIEGDVAVVVASEGREPARQPAQLAVGMLDRVIELDDLAVGQILRGDQHLLDAGGGRRR